MRIKTYQILNIIGLVAVLVVNYLANALPIAGRTTGEFSDSYPSLFTPAGLTFSIWGFIYLILIIFTIYQAKGLFKESNIPQNRYLYRIDIWFFVTSVLNVSWIFAWHYQIVWLSMVLMLLFLFSLILIYTRLDIGRRVVSRNEMYLVNMPFSIYLGWISVATIANASALLLRYNWDGWGITPATWTVIMLIIAILFTLIVLFTRKDIFYSLVIIWALAGIIYKRTEIAGIYYGSIAWTAGIGILIILMVAIFQAVKKYNRKLVA
jgi:hypothetical protein